MARVKTPRAAWIDAGLTVLADRGVAAVRVESLARELEVTKGGFYGFFGGREELLAAMLETWEREVTEAVMQRVEADGDDDPRAKLRRLMDVVIDQERAVHRVDVELAIREWARHDANAERVTARVDAVRTGYLREIFRAFCDQDEAEVRTAIAVSVRLAGHLMPLAPDDAGRERLREMVAQRLLA